MKNKILSYLAILFALSLNINRTFGQVPPSPNASALGKAADGSAGLYTGTAGIGVPLWTVSGKSIGVPVGLSYNASGVIFFTDCLFFF